MTTHVNIENVLFLLLLLLFFSGRKEIGVKRSVIETVAAYLRLPSLLLLHTPVSLGRGATSPAGRGEMLHREVLFTSLYTNKCAVALKSHI